MKARKHLYPIEIFNAEIEKVFIRLSPDNTPSIGFVFKAWNKLEKLSELYRTFLVPSNGNPRSTAESIGGAIFSIFWICDYFGDFEDVKGRIVRVKFQQESILSVGHPIFERWIQFNVNHKLIFPFYSGVPQE